jgi:DNA-binding GntR family transcriptional regulator
MSVLCNEPTGRATGVGAREHEAILEACAAREPDRAATLLATHLMRSALVLFAQLAPGADPVALRTAVDMVTSWAGEGA